MGKCGQIFSKIMTVILVLIAITFGVVLTQCGMNGLKIKTHVICTGTIQCDNYDKALEYKKTINKYSINALDFSKYDILPMCNNTDNYILYYYIYIDGDNIPQTLENSCCTKTQRGSSWVGVIMGIPIALGSFIGLIWVIKSPLQDFESWG